MLCLPSRAGIVSLQAKACSHTLLAIARRQGILAPCYVLSVLTVLFIGSGNVRVSRFMLGLSVRISLLATVC